MKKSLFLYLFLFCVQFVCAETEYSLRKYFQDNILKLDPIEGLYEMSFKQETNSPYAPNLSNQIPIALKKSYDNTIKMYVQDGNQYGESSTITLNRIGETNAYTFTSYSTKGTLYLTNNMQWHISIELNRESARYVAGNPNFAYRIWQTYSAVKSYPTSSMYLEAAKEDARKAEQEYQKALEEAQKRAGWSGSGFALNQGHIVTNYHVVEEAKTILVKGIKGDFQTELKAKVIATDKINDIAILKIDDERFNGFGAIPYKVKREMSDVGESVWALGYPMTDVMGEEVKFTDGKISSRTGIQGDMSVYQISVPIQPGNSGGALFDNNGNIVGITSSGLNREAFNSENVNYAIKTSYLYNLIESTLTTSVLPQGTAMQGQPLTQKIKLAKNFVYIIMCSSSPDFHADKLPTAKLDTPPTNNSPQKQESNSSSTRDTLSNGDIVITNPVCRNNSDLTITKVTITRFNTIIEFKWHNTKYYGGWCNIDRKAQIKDPTGKTYRLVQAENISYSPDRDDVPYNSVKTFKLHFDKVPYYIEKFDFIENESSVWNIFDIIIK